MKLEMFIKKNYEWNKPIRNFYITKVSHLMKHCKCSPERAFRP